MFFTIFIFLIVLSILVFVHEWGHFKAARIFGIKAEEFGLGLPPRIFGFYKDKNGKWKKVKGNEEILDAKDTVYSMNWIPIGGFVKIKGQDGESNVKVGEKEIDISKDNDNYINKPIWQRAIVISAGVFMNVVLAAIIFSFCFMIGMPQEKKDGPVQISHVNPGTPAESADIQAGDLILYINNTEIKNIEEIQTIVKNSNNQELKIQIQRDEETIEKNIKPENNMLGIGLAYQKIIVKHSFFVSIYEGIKFTGIVLKKIVFGLAEMIANLFSDKSVGVQIAGPVGIASLTGQFAQIGLVYLLNFVALLSLNLAVLNFLPLPALDGGHLLFLLIEKIKGSPVKKKLAMTIHNLGMYFFLFIFLIVTFIDISRLKIIKDLFGKIFN